MSECPRFDFTAARIFRHLLHTTASEYFLKDSINSASYPNATSSHNSSAFSPISRIVICGIIKNVCLSRSCTESRRDISSVCSCGSTACLTCSERQIRSDTTFASVWSLISSWPARSQRCRRYSPAPACTARASPTAGRLCSASPQSPSRSRGDGRLENRKPKFNTVDSEPGSLPGREAWPGSTGAEPPHRRRDRVSGSDSLPGCQERTHPGDQAGNTTSLRKP
eukprot:755009-Hanusia_phi.AAC.5